MKSSTKIKDVLRVRRLEADWELFLTITRRRLVISVLK